MSGSKQLPVANAVPLCPVVGPLLVDGREFKTPLDASLHLLWLLQRLSHYEKGREGEPCDGFRFREGIIAARKLLRELRYNPGEANRPNKGSSVSPPAAGGG